MPEIKQFSQLPRESPKLLQYLQSASEEVRVNETTLNANLRKEALELARSVVAALEQPEEVVMRWGFELGSQQACLRLGIDLKLFQMMVGEDNAPISASDMARRSNAEVLLVVRIMRVITSIGFATETCNQQYKKTPLTNAIATPTLEALVRSSSNDTVQISAKLSDFFRTHGYKCPSDSLACPFQWTFNTQQSYYEWTHSSIERSTDLNTCMKAMRSTRSHWTEWYPVQTKLLADAASGPQDVLIVDVGGGKGHDLENFLRHSPAAKGRLILQDLPQTLDEIADLEASIELLPHDFFRTQPILGARVYYTHFVFHNWADDKARLILAHLKAAMTPGYSKLILNESVIPDIGCPAFFAAGDINMMSMLGGIKRSSLQWIELLKSVGFDEISVSISPHIGDEEGIVEAMVATDIVDATSRDLDGAGGKITIPAYPSGFGESL